MTYVFIPLEDQHSSFSKTFQRISNITPFKMATSAVNSRAATGFKNASNYDTHRPSYPPEAVEKLLTHLGVANQDDAQIVELACGTGKFTELLAARPENFDILAVEPHTEMREELVKKKLGERVKVLEGHAGGMPIEEGWGDALIAAQVRIHQNIQGLLLITWNIIGFSLVSMVVLSIYESKLTYQGLLPKSP